VTASRPAAGDQPSALIGHTGFVGGSLDRQAKFTDRFRSTDIHTMAGRHYALVACAGAPGVKWRANREPQTDRAAIDRLLSVLDTVTADRVLLISTVDVYPEPRGVDEATPIDPDGGHPYGRHRLELERRLADRFDTLILRLPGLFGAGLRKNVIHDLLTGNPLDQVNPSSTFQFYDLSRLWADIEIATAASLRLVNLATEPVSVADVAERGFSRRFENPAAPPSVHYDMWTRYAGLWQAAGHYLVDREATLTAIAGFVRETRGSA
jgi:nucleoside-diphosphate-sugar epimerase